MTAKIEKLEEESNDILVQNMINAQDEVDFMDEETTKLLKLQIEERLQQTKSVEEQINNLPTIWSLIQTSYNIVYCPIITLSHYLPLFLLNSVWCFRAGFQSLCQPGHLLSNQIKQLWPIVVSKTNFESFAARTCGEKFFIRNRISTLVVSFKMTEDEDRLIEDESLGNDVLPTKDEFANWKRWSIIILFALFNVNMSYQVRIN